MRYFISAGEPSGDLHAASLMAKICRRDPHAEFVGLGGPKMRAAGCDLIEPLAETPIIGLAAAFKAVPRMLRLLARVKADWAKRPPDAVVAIDYPGFHWHLAKAAKTAGYKTAYFVPPQIWSWGGWRVAKVRKFFDKVLCTLPFEPAWYAERGVTNAEFVGHPFFDDLAERRLDSRLAATMRSSAPIRVALLPGSRGFEVRHNSSTLLASANILAKRFPHARFFVAAFKAEHAEYISERAVKLKAPVEIHVGATPEILAIADAAISVSGSVSLELMYYRVPTAIVYRISPFFQHVLRPLLLKSKYITLVNLMDDRVVFPEYVGTRDESAAIAQTVGDWLASPAKLAVMRGELAHLTARFGKPGAADAAAAAVVALAGSSSARRQAA